MTDTIIKHFALYLCCTYIYYHLLNHKRISMPLKIFMTAFTFILACLTFLLKMYLPAISDLLPIILLWLILGFFSSKPRLSLVAVMISSGISYAIFALSSGFILLLITPVYYHATSFPYILFMTFSGILEYLLSILLFKIRRFRKGMPFLYNTAFINVGTMVCLFFLALLTCLQITNNTPLWIRLLTVITFVIAILVLIQWWQCQLTKSYLSKLQSLELESLRNELHEKELLLSELKRENEIMGKLIHKDNKLIPAMANAVYEYLTSDNQNEKRPANYGNLLLKDLANLSEDRKAVISTLSTAQSCHLSTGISTLDALLSYMNKQACLADIKLIFTISKTLSLSISSSISSNDLVHLLADLIDNAIIATSGCINRTIQLRIYLYNQTLLIEISDTGIPFEIPSLLNFGLEPNTTHSDTGGNGIGLMDIWKIKEKYKASLHISEYKEASFSKKIVLLFDRKDQYLLSSWRCKNIIPLIKRPDLHVVDNENQTFIHDKSFQ